MPRLHRTLIGARRLLSLLAHVCDALPADVQMILGFLRCGCIGLFVLGLLHAGAEWGGHSGLLSPSFVHALCLLKNVTFWVIFLGESVDVLAEHQIIAPTYAWLSKHLAGCVFILGLAASSVFALKDDLSSAVPVPAAASSVGHQTKTSQLAPHQASAPSDPARAPR